MLVAFHVRPDLSRERHIAFLEACLAHGGAGISVVREAEAGTRQPLDPAREIARLRRRPLTEPVCYLLERDLGARLHGLFAGDIEIRPRGREATPVIDPVLADLSPRHAAYLAICPVADAGLPAGVLAQLAWTPVQTLADLALASRAALTRDAGIDRTGWTAIRAALRRTLRAQAEPGDKRRFPGLLRATEHYAVVLQSVRTELLNLDPAAIVQLEARGCTTLAEIAETPAEDLVRLFHDAPETLARISHILIDAVDVAQEAGFAECDLPETPLGPACDPDALRALRQIAVSADLFSQDLVDRLSTLHYATLADLAGTPMETWRSVYGFPTRAIAQMNAALHRAASQRTGSPVIQGRRDDGVQAFLARHVLADVTAQARVPAEIQADLPHGLEIDVYAVTPVFAETLQLLHEPTGTHAGRPVWYRIDTGPLDADPSLVILAKLCSSTLALRDGGRHDLAAAPRGTAH